MTSIAYQYRRAIARAGERVMLRRYTGIGTARTMTETEIRARVTGYEPHQLIGNIQQGDRHVLALVEDIEAGAVELPVTPADKIVIDGRECQVRSVDASTYRDGDELVAIEMTVRG